MPKVRWVIWVLQQISYAIQQCKNFENRLTFDKVTESLKVGTFFETQCTWWRRINRPVYFCCSSSACLQQNTYHKYDNVRVAPRTLIKAVFSVSSTGCNNERQSSAKSSYSAIDLDQSAPSRFARLFSGTKRLECDDDGSKLLECSPDRTVHWAILSGPVAQPEIVDRGCLDQWLSLLSS